MAETETRPTTRNRGFASMSAERQREIASQGGKAAHQKGKAHEFSSEEARLAGRRGGEAISQNRQHMAAIGAKGGAARQGRNNGVAKKAVDGAPAVKTNDSATDVGKSVAPVKMGTENRAQSLS